MTATGKLEALEDLPRTPASDVKKLGWRGVMKALFRQGKLVVTNHDEPEAVILSTEEYGSLMRAVREAHGRDEDVLDTLRRRFDERLASLNTPTANRRLRGVMDKPAKLRGKVKAGTGY